MTSDLVARDAGANVLLAEPRYEMVRRRSIDALAKASGQLAIEVGDAQIKGRRGTRPVPVEPGGVVADYVPFYFAPRSPMMSSIAHGNVPGYTGGTAKIVYLVTSVERLQELGLEVLFTDRNAVLRLPAASSRVRVFRKELMSDPTGTSRACWSQNDHQRER